MKLFPFIAISLTLCILQFVFQVTVFSSLFSQLYKGLLPIQLFLSDSLHQPAEYWGFTRDGQKKLAQLEFSYEQLTEKYVTLQAQYNAMISQQDLDLQQPLPVPKEVFLQKAYLLSGGAVWGVDKGENDGVKVNDYLFVDAVLVGKVINVQPHFSKVEMIGQGDWNIVVQTEQGVKGIIRTHPSDGNIRVEHISTDQHMNVGEYLYTVGAAEEETFLPQGLIVSQVGESVRSPSETTQFVYVRPIVDVQRAKVVTLKRWR